MHEFGPGFQRKLLEYLSDRPDAMRWALVGFSIGAVLGTIAPAVAPATWPMPAPLSLGIPLGLFFAAVYLVRSRFDLEKCLDEANDLLYRNRISYNRWEQMQDQCFDEDKKLKA